MAKTSTRSNTKNTQGKFTLFPRLPTEIRIKIFRHALSKPRIIPVALSHHLIPISSPHPLLHTNHESRACALKTHTLYQLSTPGIPPIMVNTESDYLLFTDCTKLELAYGLKVSGDASLYTRDVIRRLALHFTTFEKMFRDGFFLLIIQLLKTFPGLEEIVLVVGNTSAEGLKCGDLEFVEGKEKEVLRKGVLVELCMEVFQPWRAFEGLMSVKIVESAVGRWVEHVVRRNRDLEFEWKVPRFKIREVRSAFESKG